MAFSRQDKILVTGAAGFVGMVCIDALLDDGLHPDQIFALSRHSEKAPARGVNSVKGDILDRAGMRDIVADLQPCAIIHLAAIAEPAKARADHDGAWAVNFDSVRHLAETILDVSAETRLIFSGSAEAYGASFNDADGPVDESRPLRPATTYGATKAAADMLLGQMAHDGLKVVRFRAFNHTGPGQAPAYVVPAFAEQIARIEAGLQPPVVRVGNLEARRDFLDVRDVAGAYARAADPAAEIDGSVFNLASGDARTIRSILDALVGMSDRPISVVTDPSKLRPSDVPYAAGSNLRICKDLGWAPVHRFEDTLRDTLSFWRAHFVS
ncbi:MAG: GDP-mannose 4,6-dehydratase [Pseudomonadota bacterium]